MLKLIRNRAALVLAGLLAALCPMLMAPTGGFPSSPLFQHVDVGASSSIAGQLLSVQGTGLTTTRVTAVTSGNACTVLTASGVTNWSLCTRRSDGALVVGQNTDGSTSVDFSPQDSGTLTWTFTTAVTPNCTGTGTNASIILHRVGKIITGTTGTTNSICTIAGGTTNIVSNNAPVPAAFRPVQSVSCGAVLSNTVPATQPGNGMGTMCVTSAGNFQFFGPNNTSTSLGLTGLGTFVYTLD